MGYLSPPQALATMGGEKDGKAEPLLKIVNEKADLRRREIPHFAFQRRNSIPLFYVVPEIFLRRRKTPQKFLLQL